ncbi:hypothetical protein MRX96_053338 [Rhipicephalus microplus]
MTLEAVARLYGDFAGRAQVFSDGYVLRDGSAAAACRAPQLGTEHPCRLRYCASSTTAELVELLLAVDILRESPAVKRADIFCDSKPPRVSSPGRNVARFWLSLMHEA